MQLQRRPHQLKTGLEQGSFRIYMDALEQRHKMIKYLVETTRLPLSAFAAISISWLSVQYLRMCATGKTRRKLLIMSRNLIKFRW